jgi:import inner membrane translocase subunit TIM22
MAATADSDDITPPQEDSTDSVPNSSDALVPVAPAGPVVCLSRFVTDSAGGALMGSVFGYGFSLLFTIILVAFTNYFLNYALIFNLLV